MKKISIMLSALCLAAGVPTLSMAQSSEFTLDTKVPANPDNEPRPVFPVPTARQLKWNQTEFYAFFHYGINTYTGKEWGDGSERKLYLLQQVNPTLNNGSKLSKQVVCVVVLL